MQILSNRWSPWQHDLCAAIIFEDYFGQVPVDEELDVTLQRIDGFTVSPVVRIDGVARQTDGTYRFVDLPNGAYTINVGSRTGQWTSFQSLPQVTIGAAGPVASPAAPIGIPLWPTPATPEIPGRTVIRGKLVAESGAPLSRATVHIFAFTGAASYSDGAYTQTDADGEFYFLVTNGPRPDPTDGLLGLQIAVDHGTVPVSGGSIREGLDIISFYLDGQLSDVSDEFFVRPGRESRVIFYASNPA